MKTLYTNSVKKFGFFAILLVAQFMLVSGAFGQQVNRVPFKHRVGNPAPQNNIFKIKGDFTIIGNTSMTLLDYENRVDNSNNTMVYVDVDNDERTVNSSSSTLVFSRENGADPNCSEIIYAGLYWSGRAKPGIGQTFDVVASTKDGEPIQVEKQDHVVYHSFDLPNTHYTLVIDRNGAEGSRYPRYSFISKKGGDTYQFQFSNNNNNPVRYRVGTSGSYTTIPNQTTAINGSLRTSTFEPIVIQDGSMTIKIDQFQRNTRTEGVTADFQTEDFSARITVEGIFYPIVENKVTLDKAKVKIKGPGADSYSTVSASNNQILFPVNELQEMYAGYADITQYVKLHGIGEYTIADLALVEGNGGAVGYFGHWGIIVVYENSKMNWRDVTIFDGYSYMRPTFEAEPVSQEFVISGFQAADNGAVNLKLGVMVGEGDRGLSGDFFEVRNAANTEWVRLQHALNSPNNFFNSSIYTPVLDENNNLVDNPRNPFLDNSTGIDIAMWNVPNPDNSIIANGQTSTTFRYGSNEDTYNIYTIAFAVDAYVPEIQGFNQIEAINGETPGTELTAQPGQEIAYSLEIKNLGTEHVQDGKVIIPIPFTATFVSARHEIYFEPTTAKAPYFDPNLGATGAIVWELGELPLAEDLNTVLAKLFYTLKTTEDCFILSEVDCDPFVSVNGLISGKGGVSQTPFDGISLTQGFLDGACAGEPIQEAIVVKISGASEWVLENCPETELFRDFNFCNVDSEAGVPLSEIRRSFPVGVRFFKGPDRTRDQEITEENPFPAISGTYYAIPANSSNCVYEFRLHVTNVNTVPNVPQGFGLTFCQGATIPSLKNLIHASNADSEEAFTVFFFASETGGEALEDFTVDGSVLGTTQVWVAEGPSADCLGKRALVTISVNTCGLELEKKGSLVDVDENGKTNVGDKIAYTFIIKNTGTVPVENITLTDPIVTVVGGPLAILGPGETDSTTFSAEHILTQDDIDAGSFTNVATISGTVNGDEVSASDDDVQVFVTNPGISIVKVADKSTVSQVGEVITYTLTITNTGDVTLFGIVVRDPLTNLDSTIVSLAPGAISNIKTTYTVSQADIDSGSILNVAVATVGELEEEGSVEVPAEFNSAIAVEKTANVTEFTAVGQVVSYTITVTNTGNTTLTNVLVKDPLTGLEETIEKLTPGQSVTFQTNYTVTLEDIERGSVLNTVFVTAEDPKGDTVENTDTATVNAGKKEIIANDDNFGEFPVVYGGVLGNILANDLLDGKAVNWEDVNFEIVDLDGILGLILDEKGELSLIPGLNEAREYRLRYVLSEALNPTNTDDAIITFRLVSSDVDLSVTKTSNGVEIFEGDEFEYEIVVRNVGGTPATNVVVEDKLPGGVTYVSSRFESNPNGIQVNQELSGSTLKYTIPSMPASAIVTIYVKVKANQLNGSASNTIVNRVNVEAEENDVNPEDNTAEDVNTVKQFFIPNVITPNNDGKNDRFVIQGLNKFASNEIVILNRYGDHVYEQRNYDNNWTADGLVAGTYFFVLRGTDSNGQVQEFKGWIQVIKD